MKKTVRIIIIALGIIILGLAIWHVSKGHHKMHMGGPSYEIPMADFGALNDFELTNQNGDQMGLMDLKGRPWVANFIFTRCTGPCPVMSSHMAQLTKEFGATSLRYISFSVDPEYDTPEVLKNYAKRYDGNKNNWFFLTGDTENVHKIILDGFRLAVEEMADPKLAPGDKINHSLHFVLIDSKGTVRGYYNGYDTDARKRLDANIRTLLKEG